MSSSFLVGASSWCARWTLLEPNPPLYSLSNSCSSRSGIWTSRWRSSTASKNFPDLLSPSPSWTCLTSSEMSSRVWPSALVWLFKNHFPLLMALFACRYMRWVALYFRLHRDCCLRLGLHTSPSREISCPSQCLRYTRWGTLCDFIPYSLDSDNSLQLHFSTPKINVSLCHSLVIR